MGGVGGTVGGVRLNRGVLVAVAGEAGLLREVADGGLPAHLAGGLVAAVAAREAKQRVRQSTAQQQP